SVGDIIRRGERFRRRSRRSPMAFVGTANSTVDPRANFIVVPADGAAVGDYDSFREFAGAFEAPLRGVGQAGLPQHLGAPDDGPRLRLLRHRVKLPEMIGEK